MSGAAAAATCTRLRALLLVDSLYGGGQERQVTLLAKAMPPGWEARMVSFGGGEYVDVIRDAGVDLIVAERAWRFDVRPAAEARRVIRDWRPDVVDSSGWMSTFAAWLPCRAAGIPLVDESIRSGRVTPYRGRMIGLAARLADVSVGNSRAGLDAYGVGAGHGRVIPNGFDPGRLALCEPAERPERPFTVVMTGRMSRDKDYRAYLAAARMLHAEDPGGWRFLAIGWGADREPLIALARDLLDEGAVEMPDVGLEVLPTVRNAHVGVLVTDPVYAAEGLSNSIMEYMACRLPVVCTDSGGNRELVIEGETGLLVPPSDPDALAGALRGLRADTDACSRMGDAGRRRIDEDFSLEALVRRTIAVWEEAIAAKARRREAVR